MSYADPPFGPEHLPHLARVLHEQAVDLGELSAPELTFWGAFVQQSLQQKMQHYMARPSVTEEEAAGARQVLDQGLFVVKQVIERRTEEVRAIRRDRGRAETARRERAHRRALVRSRPRRQRACRHRRTRVVRAAAKSRTGDSGDGPAGDPPRVALPRRRAS